METITVPLDTDFAEHRVFIGLILCSRIEIIKIPPFDWWLDIVESFKNKDAVAQNLLVDSHSTFPSFPILWYLLHTNTFHTSYLIAIQALLGHQPSLSDTSIFHFSWISISISWIHIFLQFIFFYLKVITAKWNICPFQFIRKRLLPVQLRMQKQNKLAEEKCARFDNNNRCFRLNRHLYIWWGIWSGSRWKRRRTNQRTILRLKNRSSSFFFNSRWPQRCFDFL